MESLSGNLCHSRRQREKLFDFLRLFLLFGSPVVLSLILFLILVVIYNLRPFILGRGFTQTTCYVRGSEILNVTASCSAGTDLFQPCAQINVEYATGGGSTTRGVLLENEQALVNCNPCSYTFGKYGLYHQMEAECGGWNEAYDPNFCVKRFVKQFTQPNASHTCYFNPTNPSQVIKHINLDISTVCHTLLWPLLSCVLYIVAAAFLAYHNKQKRLHKKAMHQHPRSQVYMSSFDKKKRLSISLGVKPPKGRKPDGRTQYDLENQSKKMSLSVPAHLHNIHDLSPTVGDLTDHNDVILELPFALEVDDDLDMRHLDLAVSEYNIDSLTHTSYFNTPASDASYFNTPVAGAHNNPAFYNTIPLQYSHEPRCDNRSRSHDFIGLDDDVYNGILTSTPAANDAVSVTNSAMVSEQDIDTLYYKVTTHCSNAKVSLRHSSRSETTV